MIKLGFAKYNINKFYNSELTAVSFVALLRFHAFSVQLSVDYLSIILNFYFLGQRQQTYKILKLILKQALLITVTTPNQYKLLSK